MLDGGASSCPDEDQLDRHFQADQEEGTELPFLTRAGLLRAARGPSVFSAVLLRPSSPVSPSPQPDHPTSAQAGASQCQAGTHQIRQPAHFSPPGWIARFAWLESLCLPA